MKEDTWLSVTLIAILIAVAAGLGIATYDSIKHEKFLESHGCELITQQPTGRRHGKLAEYVYVYDCADGVRSEVK
jgi:hypothetical protein